MKQYEIHYSYQAIMDIEELFYYIAETVCMPISAVRYRQGIVRQIKRLALLPQAYSISDNPRLRRLYGSEVRTVRYKKMSIVFTISDNFVRIERVLAGRMIH